MFISSSALTLNHSVEYLVDGTVVSRLPLCTLYAQRFGVPFAEQRHVGKGGVIFFYDGSGEAPRNIYKWLRGFFVLVYRFAFGVHRRRCHAVVAAPPCCRRWCARERCSSTSCLLTQYTHTYIYIYECTCSYRVR